MTTKAILSAAMLAGVLGVAPDGASAAGDSQKGADVLRACLACHSLEPGRHMTGPSLAGIWGRKAGTVEGFARYSDALKSSHIMWDADTLDRWLADPGNTIPGNRMPFPGIKDDQSRADLIAYLRAQTTGGAGVQGGSGGAMMGDMMSGEVPSLKQLDPGERVLAIRYCGDTYDVTTADGQTLPFWERNLRFKTDSSDSGPLHGQPALLGAGMMGDRASVIFAAPPEISAFIASGC